MPDPDEMRDRSTPGPAWRAAEAAGIDRSLIQAQLDRTPAERFRTLSRVTRTASALRAAMSHRSIPESVLTRLVDWHVDFVVVGAIAAHAHGSSVVSTLSEVCCDTSSDNLARVHSSLAKLHPRHRGSGLALAPPSTARVERTLELRLDTDHGQLNCFGSLPGVGGFGDALRRSIELPLMGGRCRVLSLDASIEAEEARAHPRQILLHLRAIRERLAAEGRLPETGADE